MKYHEIQCQSACNRIPEGRLPYQWDLNIYRGCQHACQYCYARYSHQYLEESNFDTDIYIKMNIVEKLEEMLKKPKWNHAVINIGGVSDCYQEAEAHYGFMRKILRLLIKYKTPCIICTKSDLILRDIDLINELSLITYVNIACTITADDEKLRQRLEPQAVSYQRRWAMLKQMKERTNAVVGVHLMPIIPYLTDQELQLNRIYQLAKETKVDYVLPGMLYLKGITRPHFFDFISKVYPEYYQKLWNLYHHKEIKNEYKKYLYPTLSKLHKQYGISKDYNCFKEEKMKKPIQLYWKF